MEGPEPQISGNAKVIIEFRAGEMAQERVQLGGRGYTLVLGDVEIRTREVAGPGWEVIISAVMLEGLTPMGRPAGPLPYQHGNVEFGCLSRISSICHCLKVVYPCQSLDTMDSGTAEGQVIFCHRTLLCLP